MIKKLTSFAWATGNYSQQQARQNNFEPEYLNFLSKATQKVKSITCLRDAMNHRITVDEYIISVLGDEELDKHTCAILEENSAPARLTNKMEDEN